MGKRREARERAVQFLFQHDLNPPEDLERALANSGDPARRRHRRGKRPGQLGPAPRTAAAHRRGSRDAPVRRPAHPRRLEHRDAIDERIKAHAKNWDFPPHRRRGPQHHAAGHFEMLHREDIPPVVSINEAVDIAKKFSTQDSGKFVNGILDKIKGEMLRPAKTRNEICRPPFAHVFFRRHVHAGGTGRPRPPARLRGASP
jgi:transcription antitermination protein NusB